MKIMVFSDIHGSLYYTKKALAVADKEEVDQIIILGDIMYHGPRNPLTKDYKPLDVSIELNKYANKIIGVRGNCDAEIDQQLLAYDGRKEFQKIMLNGRDFFITHGHIFTPDDHPNLLNGTIFLSGHTHLPTAVKKDGIYYINPGSISLPKGGYPSSYAIIYKDRVEIINFDDNIIKQLKFD